MVAGMAAFLTKKEMRELDRLSRKDKFGTKQRKQKRRRPVHSPRERVA
jgi:hypothetical protein